MSKTVCPITRAEFGAHAKPVDMTVAGIPLVLAPKAFSTSSMGWSTNGKLVMKLNGVAVTCQVGFNLTIVGSKELPA